MRTYNRLIKLVSASFLALTLQAQAGYALPEYQKTTLDNGLTVYLMEQHEVPLIDVNVVVKVGAINDKKSGLAYLTAESLMLGTQRQAKSEIDEAVDFIGANISSTASTESSFIESSFAAKDQDVILSLIKDVVTAPKFSDQEFSKLKKQHLLTLEQNKESPKSVIKDYFNNLVFQGSSYNVTTAGNTLSVANITLDDLKRFHQQWYQPRNSAIVIVGDFDSKNMLEKIKALFSNWTNQSKLEHLVVKAPKELTQANVLLVNKADAIESTFIIGGLGIARNTADRVGISVINTVLGGRFTSWLNDELRVNSGLTYGAKSSFTSYKHSGSFAISSFTKTSTTIEAIDLALKTYQRLFQQGIDEKTLASAKAYVKGKFPPQFETSQDLSNLLGQMYTYDFDENYINTFEQQVNSLTVEKTQQLIKKYFPQDNLQTVIIGKAAELQKSVAKYGEMREVNINDILE